VPRPPNSRKRKDLAEWGKQGSERIWQDEHNPDLVELAVAAAAATGRNFVFLNLSRFGFRLSDDPLLHDIHDGVADAEEGHRGLDGVNLSRPF
jgi:hypothetical protein